MQVTQQLANGIYVRQNVQDAVRFVFFDTALEEAWQYATNAGVLFLVQYNNQIYGVTARHVFRDFDWRQLVVTKERFGNEGEPVAELNTLGFPTALEGAAEGSDIGDIAIIKFSNNCQSDFFEGTPYIIDAGTITASRSGDQLLIYGSLREQSETDETGVVTAQYCTFTELIDVGVTEGNPTLRSATITFADDISFNSIAGISGGPVFNMTHRKLCGMVVRGGLNGFNATVWYLDIGDIVAFIAGMDGGQEHARYERQVFR